MKRKLLALILAMALGLTACGGGDAASQDDAAEEQPDAVQIEEPEVQTANYTVVESQPYSEGMAWVVYRDEDGTTYTGAMDKEGKVRFCIEGEAVRTTPFEDGQAYIETEDGLLLVDQDGMVYDFAGHLADGGLQAYGGGYAVVYRTVNDIMEGRTTSYILVDSTGAERTLAHQVSTDGYASKGFFRGGNSGTYYVPQADLWLSDAAAEAGLPMWFPQASVIGDYAILYDLQYVHGGIPDNNGDLHLLYAGKDDTEATFLDTSALPELSNLAYAEFSITTEKTDCGLVSVEYDSTTLDGAEHSGTYFLDLENGTFLTYDGEYADLSFKDTFSVGDGRIALELTGRDSMTYLLMVDRQLNELSEPIQVCYGTENFIVDSYGIVSESGFYDLEGNQISDGSFADLDLLSSLVGDGTVKTGEGVYCDYTGQQLFENIDASGAQRLA